MTSLSNRALLVNLNISQWSARKLDKRVTSEVNTAKRATSSAGRYNKMLLPVDDLLANVHTKTGLLRAYVAKHTLPWGMNDCRILPADNYLDFTTGFRKERDEWEVLVNRFLSDYDYLAFTKAPQHLGDLYDPNDYPSVNEIADKFRVNLAVMPVPTDDFRVQLADEHIDHLRNEIAASLEQAQMEAMADCWQRLYERVKHIAEQLSKEKGRIYDSLIENAQETCSILTRLNITGDPNLERLRSEVEAKLVQHQADDLRADTALRASVAEDAKEIMAKMAVFMGGAA